MRRKFLMIVLKCFFLIWQELMVFKRIYSDLLILIYFSKKCSEIWVSIGVKKTFLLKDLKVAEKLLWHMLLLTTPKDLILK